MTQWFNYLEITDRLVIYLHTLVDTSNTSPHEREACYQAGHGAVAYWNLMTLTAQNAHDIANVEVLLEQIVAPNARRSTKSIDVSPPVDALIAENAAYD